MSARGHVDVNERRLRPIYDCLDNGNNKKALQEAEKVLRKQKDFLCAKALKSLALLRLGRHDDSTALLSDIHGCNPTDDSTLQAMGICYREMHRLDLMADMYERASKVKPDSEELLTALFMAFVRLGDYKKQQQAAMQLHRLRPAKNPYYFWAIMSIVMQAQNADEKLAKTMFLPLAERMAKKYVEENKIEAEAEVRMYLIILELQGKKKEALELIQSDLGKRYCSELNYSDTKCGELLAELEDWPQMNAIYRKLILSEPDQWQFYSAYLKSVFKLVDADWKPADFPPSTNHIEVSDVSTLEDTKENAPTSKPAQQPNSDSKESGDNVAKDSEDKKQTENTGDSSQNQDKGGEKDKASSPPVVDYSPCRAAAFLQERVQELEKQTEEKEGPHRPQRSPYLARMEFLKQLKEREEISEDNYGLGSPVELMQQYYQKFGDKPCCYADLQPYIGCLLTEKQQKEVLDKLLEELGLNAKEGEEIPSPADCKCLQRHLNAVQLQRHLNMQGHLSRADREQLINELLHRHTQGLQFGKSLLPTDFQPSDPYLLMAVHLLLDLWQETGEQVLAWQAILLLEQGSRHSPSNFHFKLLLITLYTAMGAFGPCPSLYESMDIKHVQNDSLGYVIANHISRLGHLSSAGALYDAMLRFFTLNQKDTAEYMISAYKFGAFHKIHEFLEFKTRLQNSMQYASATVERLLLDMVMETNSHQRTEQILHYMEIDPEKDRTVWQDLRDNRDFDVWMHWNPTLITLSKEDVQRSCEEEQAWLRVRNLQVRMMAAVVKMGASSGPGAHTNNSIGNGEEAKRSMSEVLEELCGQLTEHTQKCGQTYTQPPEYPLLGPFRTRLFTYLKLGLGPLLVEALQLACYISRLCENGIGKTDEKQEERLRTSIGSKLEELIASHNSPVLTTEEGHHCLHPEVLEKLVLITEVVGHLVIVAGVCHCLLKPVKTALTKKPKKKKEQATPVQLPSTFASFTAHVASLESAIETLKKAVKDLDPASKLDQDMAALSLTEMDSLPGHHLIEEGHKKEMWRRIELSYQQSGKELVDFLNFKTQYLQSLKL